MEWRHSGSSHVKNSECRNPLEKFSPRFFGIKAASSSLIIFQRAKLSTRSIARLCWCDWRTFWKENVAGRSPRGVLFLHDNAPAHRTLVTQKKLACLSFQWIDNPPYSPDLAPLDNHQFPGLKNNWKFVIFVRSRGHCSRGDLVGRTTFWIFLSGLRKLEQRAKKCIEHREGYVE